MLLISDNNQEYKMRGAPPLCVILYLCGVIFYVVVWYHLYGEIASLVLLDLISAQVINYYLVHISARHVHYTSSSGHIYLYCLLLSARNISVIEAQDTQKRA